MWLFEVYTKYILYSVIFYKIYLSHIKHTQYLSLINVIGQKNVYIKAECIVYYLKRKP